MTLTNLAKIRKKLEAFRKSQPKAVQLVAVAKSLGRKKFKTGKEPTYVSVVFPELSPLSIPNHKGRDLPPGTKNSILSSLDEDVYHWELRLVK